MVKTVPDTLTRKTKKTLPKDIKNIAIFRANALGDFVFCTPMIRCLRARYPKTKITYIGMDGHKSLIENRYHEINEVLTLPKVSEAEYISGHDWPGVLQYAKTLKGKFDVFLQVHDANDEANEFALLTGSGYTLGFSNNPDIGLDTRLPIDLHINEVNRYLEVSKLLDAPVVEYEPTIPALDADWIELERQFDIDDRPVVIIHPGAGDPRRRWPIQKFAEVGDWLAEQGYRVVITGTREEVELAEEMIGLMKYDATSSAGILSLSALIALMRVAKLFISNDTGPLHIARAVELPNIGLYARTNVVHAGPMTVRFNRVLVSCMYFCPLCNKDIVCNSWHRYHDERYPDVCNHDTSLVEDIKSEDCIQLAQEMLR